MSERERIAPPPEHNSARWHWIETEHGMMCASWFPSASQGGSWDISGHSFAASAPRVLKGFRYCGPCLLPEMKS